MARADEFVGALRERVAIDVWTAGGDDSSVVGAWTATDVAWAALAPVDSTVVENVAERRLGRPRYRLTLRAPTIASLTSRFRWHGRTLAVLRAEPDPRLRDRLTFLVEDRT